MTQLDLDALQAAAWMRNVAGIQLANVAFNWAQQPGYTLTSNDCELLRTLYKQWDANASAIPDLIDRLRKAEAASKWISVDERLPEFDFTANRVSIVRSVLVTLIDGTVCAMDYIANALTKEESKPTWSFPDGRRCPSHHITHWKPLPAAPTSADSEGEKG